MKDKQLKIDEQQLVTITKKVMDASVEQMDPAIQKDLASIRRKAVEVAAAKQDKKSGLSDWFIPAGSLAAAAAALMLVVNVWLEIPQTDELPVSPIEDVNLLSGAEEIEFYQDLDFYEWLAVHEQTVS